MTGAPTHYDQILPNPGFEITKGNTAVVITDPQKDFLSPDGVAWGIVGPSVEENNTVANLKSLIGGRTAPAYQCSYRPTTTIRQTMTGLSAARWKR